MDNLPSGTVETMFQNFDPASPLYDQSSVNSSFGLVRMPLILSTGISATYWRTWLPSRLGATVSESMEPGEEWIGGWDAVGLYEGNNKIPDYQSISIHLTTHRLILIPDPSSPSSSTTRPLPALQTLLSNVRQTEFYTGFMRSSPKITLFLGRQPDDGTVIGSDEVQTGWTCGVCGFVNPITSSGSTPNPGTTKCGLCGVGFTTPRSSSSSPSTRTGTPAPPALNPNTSEDTNGGITCPACTFLNHISMANCEICSTPLPVGSGGRKPPARPGTEVMTINLEENLDVVRLSFRKGGDKEAYRKIKSVLGSKAWERTDGGRLRGHRQESSVNSVDGINGTSSPRPGAGIDGILQSMSLDAKAQDETMQSAFQDLEVLMIRAGEMVRLAQSLNAKLTAQQASSGTPNPSEEEATLIRTSLVQLGLPTPALTQDMVRDNRAYHEGLAMELGSLLMGRAGKAGLMLGPGSRGVLGLDEVWGLWMRARGVALLPPATLISILPFLASHTSPPIRPLTLPSSLMVLHSPYYEPSNILSRLLERFTPSPTASVEPSLSLIEIAAHEGLAIGLAKELIEEIEGDLALTGTKGVSGLARDEQAGQESGGVRWYRDLISLWRFDEV